MICTECGQSFLANEDEFGDLPDVCPSCELDWLAEHCPEAFGNNNYDANNGTEGGECSP